MALETCPVLRPLRPCDAGGMLRYVELKIGRLHRGPAWIGRVRTSRSGRTIYFNGRALKRAVGGTVRGNHYDLETGEEYWVSGVKKNGQDRHWAGGGKVHIARDAVGEYLAVIGEEELDPSRYEVFDPMPSDPREFYDLENEALAD